MNVQDQKLQLGKMTTPLIVAGWITLVMALVRPIFIHIKIGERLQLWTGGGASGYYT